MKKLILMLSFIGVLVSCKSSPALVSTAVNRKAQVSLKGDWELTNVSYVGSEYIKINSFEIADSKCLIGSTWNLVSNNDTGKMALTNTNCMPYNTDLKWYITHDNQLVLKLLKDGEKPRKVTQGYILIVQNITPTSFELVDKIQIGNNPTNVTYQFKRK